MVRAIFAHAVADALTCSSSSDTCIVPGVNVIEEGEIDSYVVEAPVFDALIAGASAAEPSASRPMSGGGHPDSFCRIVSGSTCGNSIYSVVVNVRMYILNKMLHHWNDENYAFGPVCLMNRAGCTQQHTIWQHVGLAQTYQPTNSFPLHVDQTRQ